MICRPSILKPFRRILPGSHDLGRAGEHRRLPRGSTRGCRHPLAGRSRRPSRPLFTACPLRFAILGSLAAIARSRAPAAPRSSAPPQSGKLGRVPGLSVQQAEPTATPRQDAANQHQREDENLGFSSSRPRKSRHDVGVFRETSRHQSAPAEVCEPWLRPLPLKESGARCPSFP